MSSTYVQMCVHIRVVIGVYMCRIHAHSHACTHIHLHTQARICIRTHSHAYAHPHPQAQAHAPTHKSIRAYTLHWWWPGSASGVSGCGVVMLKPDTESWRLRLQWLKSYKYSDILIHRAHNCLVRRHVRHQDWHDLHSKLLHWICHLQPK